MSVYNFFKFLAFKIDPEIAHTLTIFSLAKFPNTLSQFFSPTADLKKYELDIAGVNWSFPVGLAAGLDKNAEAIYFFSKIDFGAIEVGTVTPRPQEGNPRPRMFRYPDIKSLRNRMGFNNDGMDKVLENIRSSKSKKSLGVNLGKNKVTAQEDAPNDYRLLYEKFVNDCDYLVVNVSSPNTPGLRDLQSEEELEKIFSNLQDLREKFPKPLFLKISPDLSDEGIESAVATAKKYNLAGIIATNTTIIESYGAGGMSGEILNTKAAQVRFKVLELVKGSSLEVIGVGGISSFQDVLDFWKAGGKVVQIYTSFIYQGPKILADIKKGIDDQLKKHNVDNLKELLEILHKK